MNVDKLFDSLKEQVRSSMPSDVRITDIRFEGPLVVVYTDEYDKLSADENAAKTVAQTIHRRVDIRPDPSGLEDPSVVEQKIRSMIPENAEIFDINFLEETGEAIVEAIYPNEAVGREGRLLADIRQESGWNVKVIRAPPIPSKTVSDVRGYLRANHEERQEMLESVARRIARPTIEAEQWVRVTAMGGFRQVGRSASLLTTRESKILIDCGLDPSSDATPYFGIPEAQPLSDLDAVVLTHAHLDHCGTLPALFKYGYRGPVYCTPPTRDLMALLQLDNIKLGHGENRKTPYDAAHVRQEILHTITLKYNEVTDISPDVRLTFYNAGHILGSAIAHFHIGEGLHNVAFSGDTKYEKTWLFNPANTRFPRLETLIMESTYGGHNDMQPTRADASEQLGSYLTQAVEGGGKVLIPVFAVGRSQEVMLVIEELVRTGRLPQITVWLDGMIWEATAIHTAYPEYLNSQLRTQIFQHNSNPFLSPIFRRVETAEMREQICHSPDPCIVLATSGMMSGGPVMEYFREWADDERNWLLFVGYQSEGSIGRTIQRGRPDITLSMRGMQINLKIRMQRETVDGFSGHSDRKQLMRYINALDPRPNRIIIGHGDDRKCTDLASSIYKKYGIETKAPQNLETIRLKRLSDVRALSEYPKYRWVQFSSIGEPAVFFKLNNDGNFC